jgi:hypothetical protein
MEEVKLNDNYIMDMANTNLFAIIGEDEPTKYGPAASDRDISVLRNVALHSTDAGCLIIYKHIKVPGTECEAFKSRLREHHLDTTLGIWKRYETDDSEDEDPDTVAYYAEWDKTPLILKSFLTVQQRMVPL